MENFDRIKQFDINTLKCQLASAKIDISKWGAEQAKTPEHLLEEVENGESILVTDEAGELLRKVVMGGVSVYYTSSDGKRYRLKEEKQIFKKDNRERRRVLEQSVLEKMKPNEDPEEAMIRGIREELGIKGEIVLTKIDMNEESEMSTSYPGLLTQFTRHIYETTLNDEQFRPDGYTEEQPDKSTHFIWEEVK